MLRTTPWAVLALSHFARAQFDLLHARSHTEECCPCSNSGAPNSNAKTVTVTEPAGAPRTVIINAPPYSSPSKETITVHHTVTEPGSTIYVTHVEEHTVTKEFTAVPAAFNELNGKYDETATITSGPASPSEQAPKGKGDEDTKTVVAGSSNRKPHNKYLNITVGDNGDEQTRIITTKNPDGSDVVKTLTVGGSKGDYETKTIQEGDKRYTVISKPTSTPQPIEEGKDYTIVVKPEPSTKTIVLNDGRKSTEVIKVPHTITVISPQTVTQKGEYQTITNTLTHHNGQNDVEIIIIDKETGKSTCKTESGLPCRESESWKDADSLDNESGQAHGDVSSSKEHRNGQKYDAIKNSGGKEHYVTATEADATTQTECPLMAISTKVQTVYNTVVMTVGPNGGKAPKPTETATTPAAAQPTDGRKMRIRRSGAQLPAWW